MCKAPFHGLWSWAEWKGVLTFFSACDCGCNKGRPPPKLPAPRPPYCDTVLSSKQCFPCGSTRSFQDHLWHLLESRLPLTKMVVACLLQVTFFFVCHQSVCCVRSHLSGETQYTYLLNPKRELKADKSNNCTKVQLGEPTSSY